MTHDLARTVELLIADEGFRQSAYQDHLGFTTIGHGILIDGRKGGGITWDESLFLLKNRVMAVESGLDKHIPWWRDLSPERCSALVSMAYQMGLDGLLGFKQMLKALQAGDNAAAADHALDSKWADQTPKRAYRISQMIRG